MVNHYVFSPNLLSAEDLIASVVFALHNAGTAYVVLDWWIPAYFQKKRYGLFLVATILTLLLFSTLLFSSLLLFFNYTDLYLSLIHI